MRPVADVGAAIAAVGLDAGQRVADLTGDDQATFRRLVGWDAGGPVVARATVEEQAAPKSTGPAGLSPQARRQHLRGWPDARVAVGRSQTLWAQLAVGSTRTDGAGRQPIRRHTRGRHSARRAAASGRGLPAIPALHRALRLRCVCMRITRAGTWRTSKYACSTTRFMPVTAKTARRASVRMIR